MLAHLLEDLGELIFREKDLLARFNLPRSAQDLLAIDPGYRRSAVVCRPDCIWNGERLFVVEINADSPAMMTFTDYLERLMSGLFPIAQVSNPDREPVSRTRVLYDSLLSCYREWGGQGQPTIAIVDWNDVKTLHEQRRTALEFNQFGSEAVVCDPREMKLENGRLVAHGRKIDLIYRRVLFMDFIRRAPELAPMFEAYRDGKVCVVNPLRSFILGNKLMLALLHDPEVLAYLRPEQRQLARDLITPTYMLEDKIEETRVHREQWVVKGAFGYGGRDVAIGKGVTESSWDTVLRSTDEERWIAQRFVLPTQMMVPVFDKGTVKLEPRWANWNPWIFGGRFAGGMTRTSGSMIVSITQQGALLPSISVEERVVREERATL